MSYHKLLRADPVVLWELDIKLDVQITFLEGVSVLWHAFASHHPDRTWKRINMFPREEHIYINLHSAHCVTAYSLSLCREAPLMTTYKEQEADFSELPLTVTTSLCKVSM